MLRTISLTAILSLLAAGIAAAQGETTLTFDPNFTHGQLVPQDYGDNVTGPVTNGYSYGGSGIFTPDVTVAYSAGGGNCSSANPPSDQLKYHQGPFQNLGGCIRSFSTCESWDVTLAAGSGFQVQLHGFDLGRDTSFSGGFSAITVPEVTVFDDLTQAVLFTQTNVVIHCLTTCNHASFDFSPPLSAATIRIHISTLGLGTGSSLIGMDNVRFSQASASIPAQANTAAANLQINGAGPLGVGGPFTASPAGSTVTFDWAGPPGQPYLLLAGPIDPVGFFGGCIGTVHVGTPSLGFSDVLIIFDGTSPVFPNPWFQLDATGQSQQSFSIPPGPPGSIGLQGLVLQAPGSSCPFVLTTAFQLSW